MRNLTVLVLLSIPVFCQYSEIVTADDGQQVYFTTQLVEQSAPTGTNPESRVFRIDGRRFQLFAERGSLARTDAWGSNDGASSLQVTGDGQSVAFVLTNVCPPGDPCRTTIQRAEIRGRDATVLGEANRVLLSRNGQWALLVPPVFSPGGRPGDPPTQNTEAILVDLATGDKSVVGMPLTADGSFALASNGNVLQRVRGVTNVQIGIGKSDTLKPLPEVSGAIAFLGMSDDAGTVLVSRLNIPPPGEPLTTLPVPDLIVIDVRAGTSKVLQSLGIPGRYILLGISNDGRRALLRALIPSGDGLAVLFDIETGKSARLMLSDDERPVSGALSGDGNSAILGLSNGRMSRFTVDSSLNITSIEELLPAMPYFHSDLLVAPGALIEVERPLSGDIDWTGRIQLNKMPLAVVRGDTRQLTLQVPWEIRTGLASVSIDYPSDSPLAQRSQLFVAQQWPRFVAPAAGATGILRGMLIKGDFSGYVTAALEAGDTFHMYMTGLGAVRGTVKTGEPAPLNDTRPLTGYAHCMFTPHTTDAETLFAGLAPGMIGIYQLTFRLPADTPTNFVPTGVRCGFNTAGYSLIMQQIAP